MDITHATHRNKVFLMTYTEYVYRKLIGNSNYSMQEISGIVEGYSKLDELNDFFDRFTVKFADFCSEREWDKTSASLGVDNAGNNIAKSTKDLLNDFRDYINTNPI